MNSDIKGYLEREFLRERKSQHDSSVDGIFGKGEAMIIGVPKEIKEVEKRVGMTPQGVDALVAHGHRVLVERGGGGGQRFL